MRRLMIVGAALLLAGGCAPSTEATPTPTPAPADIAAMAGQRMLSVHSLHFVIELSGQPVYLDSSQMMALKRAEGDLEQPDRVRAIARVSSFGVASEIGIIGIGDDRYATNPLNQQWERLPEGYGWYFDPAVLMDPEYGVSAVLTTSDWTFSAPENPEDAATYHVLHGDMPGERLRLLTSGLIESGNVAVDVWVDREDGYVHRIYIVEVDSDPENPTRWQITFSAFDEPVNIQPPPVP